MRTLSREIRPHLQPTLDGSRWEIIGHDGRCVARTADQATAEISLLAITNPEIVRDLIDRDALDALERIVTGNGVPS